MNFQDGTLCYLREEGTNQEPRGVAIGPTRPIPAALSTRPNIADSAKDSAKLNSEEPLMGLRGKGFYRYPDAKHLVSNIAIEKPSFLLPWLNKSRWEAYAPRFQIATLSRFAKDCAKITSEHIRIVGGKLCLYEIAQIRVDFNRCGLYTEKLTGECGSPRSSEWIDAGMYRDFALFNGPL